MMPQTPARTYASITGGPHSGDNRGGSEIWFALGPSEVWATQQCDRPSGDRGWAPLIVLLR